MNEPPPVYDVSGDNYLKPQDALLIINFLNQLQVNAALEGEGDLLAGADLKFGLIEERLLDWGQLVPRKSDSYLLYL